MKKQIYCLLAMLCLFLCERTHAVDNIQPLGIGDTLPPGFYRLLAKEPAIDLQGKALLLDFWETSCGNCLSALPLLDSLQKQFAYRLQVITITSKGSPEKITGILKRYPRTRQVSLPLVTSDSLLRQYFPFTMISHLVWIDSSGIVRAITGTSSLSAGNISKLVRGEILALPVKKDVIDFDYQAPVLGFTPGINAMDCPLYYDAISGHLNGVDATNSSVSDSAGNISRFQFFNMSLLQLCRIALENSSAGIPSKQLVLEVPDKSRYLQPARDALPAWKEHNTFCYFLQVPFTLNRELQKQQVRNGLSNQLKMLFGLSMQRKELLLPCLVLRLAPKPPATSTTTKGSVYHNLSELLYALNENTALPWVYNETGLHGLAEMQVTIGADAFSTKEALNEALAAYGLMVTEEQRLQVRYILKEGMMTNN